MDANIIGLDHVAVVVPDLDAAVGFYVGAFGMTVVCREADTDVDADAIGLPGELVRLRGALLASGSTMVELHEYLSPRGTGSRRVCDTGIGHLAFAVRDIEPACKDLTAFGVRFHTPPRLIAGGTLAGRRWVYGTDPWGVVIELCQHPDP